LITILFLSSCETTEKIDDFPLRPKKLVVNCYFAEDSAWNFQVSHSLSVLDNADLKAVDNATILLYKGEQFLDTIKMGEYAGWYRDEENLPEQDQTYSIEVTSPDFAAVLRAEDFVPLAVPVSDVSTIILDSSFYEETYPWGSFRRGRVEGIFEISIKDPAQVENYYELSVYTHEINYDWEDSTIVYDYIREVYVNLEDGAQEDFFASGNDLLFSDYLFDGQNYKVKLNFREWDVRPDQEFIIELTSLNRTGYLYKKSISDYEQASGDPFSEPVRIYCNIENGYGIFTGYSTHSFEYSLNQD
jgi:hypothetical protein